MKSFTFQRVFYNSIVLPLGLVAARAGARFNEKLSASLDVRKDWENNWRQKSKHVGARPVWFHVSSVGEFEQAGPVIRALYERRPDIPVAVTFLSPSGFRYASDRGAAGIPENVHFIEYLPIDTRRNAGICLELLRPRVLVFVKFDLWPNLIWESSSGGVPIVLIDGTLSPSSKRLSTLGRSFYRAIYSRVDAILAISSQDAERFRAHCPDHPCIVATGDTRFDRVVERARAPFGERPFHGQGPTIIAGSTWPPDEEKILAPLGKLMEEKPLLRLIVAPHEPAEERVEGLLRWARCRGVAASRWSERKSNKDARLVLIDRVGILAELYRTADIAYVGGSFSTGVHSVLEPAATGIPVLFGPRHLNSLEAAELLEAGGALSLEGEEAAYRTIKELVEDEAKRATMGERARRYVESKTGATERCIEELSAYL